MDPIFQPVVDLMRSERVVALVAALGALLVGLLIARLASAAVRRIVARRGTAQQVMVARRTVFYGIMGISLIAALDRLGIDLKVLLGAAGVLTVAIGFASQTAASNLISGLFMLGDRFFVVGDIIRVSGTGTTGEVISLDMLAVKLRTPDNLSVRIPNEVIIKSEITNFTRFPIRRVAVLLSLPHDADLSRVRRVLFAVADRLPRCLDEPRPELVVNGFTESALDLELWVWARREVHLDVASELRVEIAAALAAEGIEVGVQRRLVRVVEGPRFVTDAGDEPR